MKKVISAFFLFILVGLVFLPSVTYAAEINDTITEEEKAIFDAILAPINKIYNFIKYSAALIAAIALLYAGISYMMSGNDPRKRDTSKNLAGYVIIGLVIIWAAPFIVQLFA